MQKKADVATDIATIKNDNVTNASLTSQLNDLKSQHIATEVTSIGNKTKINASDILALENKLRQKEDTINENERGLSFNGGLLFYKDYLTYKCKLGSFGFGIDSKDISEWKSTGINNHSSDSNMNAIVDCGGHLPNVKGDGRIHVHLIGSHFQQNKVIIPNNNNAINIYCVYQLDSIASSRDTSFTIQNALFGAMQITKNATDSDKNNYKGYGICFDERSQFGHTITENGVTYTSNGRNALIFGADMSFSVHATNKANHIYLMGDGLFLKNFTEPNVKFVLSLHYNSNDSYLFVNDRQELKFKAKMDQLVKEKLCIGNLSDQWTTSESEKTGLYRNIYDFVIDYEEILLLKTIYDMHRYLMIKTYKMYYIRIIYVLYTYKMKIISNNK